MIMKHKPAYNYIRKEEFENIGIGDDYVYESFWVQLCCVCGSMTAMRETATRRAVCCPECFNKLSH